MFLLFNYLLKVLITLTQSRRKNFTHRDMVSENGTFSVGEWQGESWFSMF